MPKTILVTGGAGFIGSHLVDRLIKEGYRVAIIDNLSTGKKGYNPPAASEVPFRRAAGGLESHSLREWAPNLNPKAKFYKIDICNPEIAQIFKKEKPKIVFHYAAQIDVRKSVEDPIKDAKINVQGSLNILENCQKFKVKKFIFASTGGALYGEADIVPTPEIYPEWPLSPYGIEKLTVEKYLNYYYKVFRLPFISLRLANIYGPRQNSKGEAGVVAIFCDKMLSGEQAVINGDGQQTRDFVFVDDIVEANILAMGKNKVGIFNIGTAKETSINELFGVLKKITKFNVRAIHDPAKKGEQGRSCLDFSKAKKELGWFPKYDLESGLKETLKWFKSK